MDSETPEQRFDRVWAELTTLYKEFVMKKVASGIDMDRMIYEPRLHIYTTKEDKEAALSEPFEDGVTDIALAV